MASALIHIVAAAAAVAAAHSGLFNDGSPPQRFRQDATVVVEMRDQLGIDSTCQAMFGRPPQGMKTNACFTGEKIIMPNPCSYPKSDAYAHMLCHEMGHVNGWPATHGN